jgi:hypothetical protein
MSSNLAYGLCSSIKTDAAHREDLMSLIPGLHCRLFNALGYKWGLLGIEMGVERIKGLEK